MRSAALVALVLVGGCKKKEKELAQAAARCDETAVRALLAKGADAKATVEKKPIISASAKCISDQCEVVEALLDAGADANARNDEGAPLLSVAAAAGHAPCARALLAHGARIDDVDALGQTALMVAARDGHLGVVELLLDRRANVGIRSKKGETALSLAESQAHPLVAAALQKAGAQ